MYELAKFHCGYWTAGYQQWVEGDYKFQNIFLEKDDLVQISSELESNKAILTLPDISQLEEIANLSPNKRMWYGIAAIHFFLMLELIFLLLTWSYKD